MDTAIDMYGLLETIPHGSDKPLRITPDRRYWPNPVSGQFCAHIYRADDGYDEYWYDVEGQPLDGGPAIRNRRQITEADLKAAFFGGVFAVTQPRLFTIEFLDGMFARWKAEQAMDRYMAGTNLCNEVPLPPLPEQPA